MRRFHNPRFAPESLERKLSPSGIVPVPVAAHVYVPTQGHAVHASATAVAASTGLGSTGHVRAMRSPDAGDPPIDTPVITTGPDLPA